MRPEFYLDFNGSTPIDPEVRVAHDAWLERGFGNASAAHPEGLAARAAIDRARHTIAAGLGAAPDEILFTSGGTESNNWALIGSARSARAASRQHLVVSAIEHKSVLETAKHLAAEGCSLTIVPVDRSGAVDSAAVRDALREDTFLVSVMFANNETGVVQPTREIGALCRERGIRYHCDAVSAVGKLPVDVREINCDLLSLSSHKLYAPKGCGVLYVRSGVPLSPLIHGCGQQCGMRGGTENTAGAVAFGRAFERLRDGAFRPDEQRALTERLWREIQTRFPRAERNGRGAFLPNTLSVAFPGSLGVELQAALGKCGISVAAGAAATNGAPSHVLMAMGCGEVHARSTLRFSLGATTRAATIEFLVDALADALHQRANSPAVAAT